MTSLPTITVVCPTYNSSPYIERTLRCLGEQEALPWEIVFSDDGSDDDTVSRLESSRPAFKTSGVRLVILRNPHKGAGESRNAGIRVAKGEWIAFLDADDVWSARKLRRVAETIQRSDGANFIIHWEDYLRLNGERSVMEHGSGYDVTRPLEKQVYRENCISTSAVVCRKELLERVGGFDGRLPVSQDYELWLRLSPLIRLEVIAEVLGTYIEEPSSITARPYYKRLPPLLRIYYRHRDKGGTSLFLYRSLRAIASRQWLWSFRHALTGRSAHPG